MSEYKSKLPRLPREAKHQISARLPERIFIKLVKYAEDNHLDKMDPVINSLILKGLEALGYN